MTDMEFINETVKKVNAKLPVSKSDVAKSMDLIHVVRENGTADCNDAQLRHIGGLLSAALSRMK